MVCALLLSVVCAIGTGVISADAVTISQQEYEVYYTGRHSSFLCNKKTAGNAVGTEYFLTYTVKSFVSSGSQNGFLGTSAPETSFPYTDNNGLLYYQQRKSESETPQLLMEGYTYFVKFTVTESGYRYLAARAKGNSSEYFVIEGKTAAPDEGSTNFGYFGLWFGDGVTEAHLTDVRFYDASGNDLGVWSPRSLATVVKSGNLAKDTEVEHWYRVSSDELINLAISNEHPLTTDKMFIEFSVSEAESTCVQSGISLSNYPENTYPHANGSLKYESIADGESSLLLEPGSDYLIALEKANYGFTAYVQITKDGKTTAKVFPLISGTYDKTAQYFSLWFGTGANSKTSFTLENFKIYDSEKNNLGVQANNSSVQIRHFGAILDYAACEGVYYCEESANRYTLYADQTLTYEADGQKLDGTYSIKDNKITIVLPEGTETYDYLYRGFTASNGNYFKRLYTYRITFVAGNGTENAVQLFDMEKGYIPTKPADPVLDGCSFEGWYTIDGKEYDFDAMVTKSYMLYAKWTNGAGITYLASEDNTASNDSGISSGIVITIICVAIAAVAIVISALIIKGGFKRDKNAK